MLNPHACSRVEGLGFRRLKVQSLMRYACIRGAFCGDTACVAGLSPWHFENYDALLSDAQCSTVQFFFLQIDANKREGTRVMPPLKTILTLPITNTPSSTCIYIYIYISNTK